MHRLAEDTAGDIAGDALYAALIYALFALIAPRVPRSLIAAGAIMFCTAIELFQLTGLPVALAREFPASALVFGSGFDQRDLLVYPIGVLAIALLDTAITRAGLIEREHKTGASPKEDARSD